MNITKEGSELLLSELKKNNLAAVSISIIEENEQASIHLEMISADEIKDTDRKVTIENVPVIITEEDEEALEDITFDADGNDLVVLFPHHHHDGCCCHDHEGDDHDCCCHDHDEGVDCCCCHDDDDHDCCCCHDHE